MNLRLTFGKALKEHIRARIPVERIGSWVYDFYSANLGQFDYEFHDILVTLFTMELGPEFAFSYEELDKIADDLIAGRKVEL